MGTQLTWERLDEKRACRIKYVIQTGGYRSPESQWPQIHNEMVSAMTKFELTFQPALDSLKL